MTSPQQIKYSKSELIFICKQLIQAYEMGELGICEIPEESSPSFKTEDERLNYFSLPMGLNYQRNSQSLWESAKNTYLDPTSNSVFDIKKVVKMDDEELRKLLLKYKLALQPNRHTYIWNTLSNTIHHRWGSINELLEAYDCDFLLIKNSIQKTYKTEFPYLSGHKLFNYWCFILSKFCKVDFKNKDYIDVAVDTHILKCSIKLGIIDEKEAIKLPGNEISNRWRELLSGSDLSPVDMNLPLWFWSRNGFIHKI
jgi:hypothetical protein